MLTFTDFFRFLSRIPQLFCRHKWRPSTTDVTASVCTKCGRRSQRNGPRKHAVYTR